MKQVKYIGDITVDELKENHVFICRNEEGFLSILLKNSLNKTVLDIFNTDNLEFKLNAVLKYNNMDYFFHIIVSKNKEYYGNQQFFVIYDYLFSKIDHPIKDYELTAIITSLENFFKISPDKEYRSLQIGVFGELLILKKLYESGYQDIVSKYHDDFYSKHDVEISSYVRMEIKTVAREKRIHSFKHNQISRTDCEVFVASSVIETTQIGVSLFEIFESVIKLFNNPDMIFSLRKLMKKCNISDENQGIKVSYNNAYDNVKFYNASDLPKLDCNIPDGISNIIYDVDCSLAKDIKITDLIEIFSNERQ